MSEQDLKRFRRQIIIAVLSPLIIILITVVWSQIGNHFAIKDCQKHKIDRVDAYKSYSELLMVIEAKNARWDEYIKSNDKDKEDIMRQIERLEDQIDDLRKELFPVRGDEEISLYE